MTNYRSFKQDLIFTNRAIGGTSRTGNITASTTSKKVPTTALSNRHMLIVYNNGSSNVFYGYAATVSATTGMIIAPGEKIQKVLNQGAYLWVIAATAVPLLYEETSPD